MKPSHRGKPRPKPDHKSKNSKPATNKHHGNWSQEHPTGIKPAAAELTKRIHQVADLLCAGYKSGEIAAAMNAQFKVSARTTESYLSRAKALILEEVGRPKDEHRAESFGYYQKMSHDKEAPASVRLHARELIGDLLGLDAPKRAEISGPEGAPIAFGDVKVYLPAKRAIELVEANGDGNNERG